MSAINGGPAFPVNELDQRSGNIFAQHMGLTVRDYFAAKALQGYCAVETSWHAPDAAVARWSYAMADAMLTEREQKGAPK